MKKVGIITFHCADNFGLFYRHMHYKKIKDMGYG